MANFAKPRLANIQLLDTSAFCVRARGTDERKDVDFSE